MGKGRYLNPFAHTQGSKLILSVILAENGLFDNAEQSDGWCETMAETEEATEVEPDSGPQEMRRFWFCTYDSEVLFHATFDCSHLRAKDWFHPDGLSVAHISMERHPNASPIGINFCDRCVPDEIVERLESQS